MLSFLNNHLNLWINKIVFVAFTDSFSSYSLAVRQNHVLSPSCKIDTKWAVFLL